MPRKASSSGRNVRVRDTPTNASADAATVGDAALDSAASIRRSAPPLSTGAAYAPPT
jgi:hypothetical protein